MNSLLLLGLSPKQLAPGGTGRAGTWCGLGGQPQWQEGLGQAPLLTPPRPAPSPGLGGGGCPALPSQHQGRLGPRVPGHKAARSTPRFRRGRGAWDTDVSRDQRDPGLRPRAPPSPCPQCPEGLACALCPAHLASSFFLCAQVSPLPKPGPLPALWPLSRCVCVCVGGGAVGGLRA